MSLDLSFSDEQEMLRDTVRGVCATYADYSVVREMEDDPNGYPPELWKQLAHLDMIGLMLPTEYGGSGMTALEGAVVYEEFGRALAPSPHFCSAVLAGEILARSGSDEQRQEWLPEIATGDQIFTVASLEPDEGFGPRAIATTATQEGDNWILNGTKWHVPFASVANRMLVLARTGQEANDISIFAVDPATKGVGIRQMLSLASDTQYEASLKNVSVTATDLVGIAGQGWGTWEEVMGLGAVLLAAQACGGAQQTLDMTVEYSKDRNQFGKPLGAFQALSHYMADAKTSINGATALTYEAAWALAKERDESRKLAPMAKLFSCRTYRDTTAMAQQLFGGVGFTVEYDIQLYFRRAKQLQMTGWNDRACEERIATAVLD